MPITRSVQNPNQVTEWTEEVNLIPNTAGFIRGMGLFNVRGTKSTSITFDVNKTNYTLLPSSSRGSKKATHGKDRNVITKAFALAFFKHEDLITPEDILDQRKPGTADMEETLANVRVTKMTDMRNVADFTDEYLRLTAMTGKMVTPDGVEYANMFQEFGITQTVVDFDLSNPLTDIDAKILALKNAVTKGLQNGSGASGVTVIVDEQFFNDLINHPKFREVWLSYQNAGYQRLRDDLSQYFSFGVVSFVEHRGVTFIAYNPEFPLPDGSTEQVFAAGEGVAFATGARDLFRGYCGPANKLTETVGQPVFMFEYTDPRDEYHELELQMAPLYFCTRPASLIKVTV